jgi:hypothetical protein
MMSLEKRVEDAAAWFDKELGVDVNPHLLTWLQEKQQFKIRDAIERRFENMSVSDLTEAIGIVKRRIAGDTPVVKRRAAGVGADRK